MAAVTRTSPVRLLLVDDDESIRLLLEVTLEFDDRFELIGAAGTGDELLAYVAASGDIDAILVDVTLPDRDGIELVRELRGLVPHAAIALYTGWSDPDLVERAVAAGANSVFTKSGDTLALFADILALVD